MFACALPARPAEESGGIPPFFGIGGDPEKEKQGEQVLIKYLDASRRGVLRGASMVTKFVGRLPKLGKSAEISARRHVNAEGAVQYPEVMGRDGDSTVQKDIIARFMRAEEESSTNGEATKEKDKVAITPGNYKFKYKGLQTKESAQIHVFELTPRKKRVGLFKGELWVDADTGLTVREAGRLVKSPSVFLKRVEFTREYEIRNGQSVPKAMSTTIVTRFWGVAELQVEYSGLAFDDLTTVANATGAANH